MNPKTRSILEFDGKYWKEPQLKKASIKNIFDQLVDVTDLFFIYDGAKVMVQMDWGYDGNLIFGQLTSAWNEVEKEYADVHVYNIESEDELNRFLKTLYLHNCSDNGYIYCQKGEDAEPFIVKPLDLSQNWT
jgi:hypothetical protein